MTAILRNESKRHQRGALVLTGALAITIGFFLAVFPAMKEEAELIEAAYPDFMMVLLGFEELHTIEGFAGGYVYTLVWILFTGIYIGYISAGLIAGDIRSRKLDLTLANPVSRESVLAQKVTSLWLPLLVLNVGVMATVLVGAVALGEHFDIEGLFMVHLLGLPYLLVCAGIGVVLSTTIDRVGTAQVGAIGAIFMLWLIDGLSELDADFEWIGDFTPSRYYDPSAILVREEYAFGDAALLLLAFLLLLAIATIVFVRRDI